MYNDYVDDLEIGNYWDYVDDPEIGNYTNYYNPKFIKYKSFTEELSELTNEMKEFYNEDKDKMYACAKLIAEAQTKYKNDFSKVKHAFNKIKDEYDYKYVCPDCGAWHKELGDGSCKICAFLFDSTVGIISDDIIYGKTNHFKNYIDTFQKSNGGKLPELSESEIEQIKKQYNNVYKNYSDQLKYYIGYGKTVGAISSVHLSKTNNTYSKEDVWVLVAKKSEDPKDHMWLCRNCGGEFYGYDTIKAHAPDNCKKKPVVKDVVVEEFQYDTREIEDNPSSYIIGIEI